MNISIFKYFSTCFLLPGTNYQAIAFNVITVPSVLPMCVYILYLGAQQWWSRAKMSHTDFFTYNLAFIQLIGILGSCLLSGNLLFHNPQITTIGILMFLVSSSSVLFFQIITCLERYLAVVCPIKYLNLKSQTWGLIRNLSCGLVWFQCIVQSVVLSNSHDFVGYFTISLIHLSLSILVVLFCNLRVLYVLMRPGPGEGAKGIQANQKSLTIITAITAGIMVKFGGDLLSLCSFLFLTHIEYIEKSCVVHFSGVWFNLPSTLSLPMLFLHRHGKLSCCKTKSQN